MGTRQEEQRRDRDVGGGGIWGKTGVEISDGTLEQTVLASSHSWYGQMSIQIHRQTLTLSLGASAALLKQGLVRAKCRGI